MSELLRELSNSDFVMVSPEGSPVVRATHKVSLSGFDTCDITATEQRMMMTPLPAADSDDLPKGGDLGSFATGPSTYAASPLTAEEMSCAEDVYEREAVASGLRDESLAEQLDTVAVLSHACEKERAEHDAMSETVLRAALSLPNHVLLPTRWDGEVPLNPYDSELSLEEYLQSEIKHVKDVVVSQCIPVISRVGGVALGYAAGLLDDVRFATRTALKDAANPRPIFYTDIIPVDMGATCSFTTGNTNQSEFVTAVPPPTLPDPEEGPEFVLPMKPDNNAVTEGFDLVDCGIDTH